MNQHILDSLSDIQRQIDSGEVFQVAQFISEWGGADVIISDHLSDRIRRWLEDAPSLVLSAQSTVPQRRAVISEYAKELSWLFVQLREAFSGSLNYINKYDFYGRLAQTALDYIQDHGENTQCQGLLHAVLAEARKMADEGF